MTDSTPRLAYTMNEAMGALRTSRATIYKLINSGTLRTYRVGKRRYCTHDALVECQQNLEIKTID